MKEGGGGGGGGGGGVLDWGIVPPLVITFELATAGSATALLLPLCDQARPCLVLHRSWLCAFYKSNSSYSVPWR